MANRNIVAYNVLCNLLARTISNDMCRNTIPTEVHMLFILSFIAEQMLLHYIWLRLGLANLSQLEQLECLRYEDPPDYSYYWFILDFKSKQDKVKVTNLKNLPKLPFLEFYNKPCMWHTFWSCLIRCVNRQWIWLVLTWFRPQTDGQIDRQGETIIPPFNFFGRGAGDGGSGIESNFMPLISVWTDIKKVCHPWLSIVRPM